MSRPEGADQIVVVDLQPLSTAKERCLFLRTGPVDAQSVEVAKQRRYDQLPVLDERGVLLGVIPTDRARALVADGQTLEPTDAAIDLRELERLVFLPDLLEAMAQHRAIVFRNNEDAASDDPDWFALVTISDLNRHHFRSYLYPMFARLEAALAALIDQAYEDHWDWLRHVREESQTIILGRWELDKRKGVDTTPLNGCMLTDLMTIAQNSKAIREELGYSKTSMETIARHLRELRNCVMHPVRPLVTSEGDVAVRLNWLNELTELTERVTHVNGGHAAAGSESVWFHHG